MNNPSPTPVPPAQEQELDALTYIPVPPIDQLCVQGWDSHSTFKNLNLAQKSIWDSEKAAKLLAYKAYRGRIEGCEEIAVRVVKPNLLFCIHQRDSEGIRRGEGECRRLSGAKRIVG